MANTKELTKTFNSSAIAIALFLLMTVGNWAMGLDYHMNLHWKDMSDTVHTYKLYDHWIHSILDVNPIDSLNLYIDPETGDYYGANADPRKSKQNMQQWMYMCEHNPSEFTFSGFNKVQYK